MGLTKFCVFQVVQSNRCCIFQADLVDTVMSLDKKLTDTPSGKIVSSK